MATQAAVVMRDITMAFGENTVLRGVDLTINSGQVTALLGANGAGKSTLIKILSGVYTGHGGVVEIDGVPQTIDSPMTARRIGLQTVHQRIDEGVIPGLSIAENLLFEQIAQNEISRIASLRSLIPKAREVAEALHLDWSDSYLRKDVFEIGVADKQLLILARALARRPRLLILDEPTSALSQAEVDRLFVVINDLRSSGIPVLYVSHRLGEIETLADRLVVLRDGRIRGEQSAPFDWTAALKDMLGEQTVVELESFEEQHGTATVLDLKSVQLFTRSAPFDLEIRGGEVTGVIGLLGSGKSELARGIFGADSFVQGSMLLGGKAFAPSGPADAIHNDVYLVPEDRAGESMLPGWSIARTASLPVPQVGDVARRAQLRQGAHARHRPHRRVLRRRGKRRAGGRLPVGRQSAEGGRRPLAARHPSCPAPRRALPRRRHRSPPRHLAQGA